MADKHTPGPWRVSADGDADGDDVFIIGRPEWKCTRNGVEGEWDVATINDLSDKNRAEMLANSRLIAAAPDLLALAYQYRDDLRHPPAPDSRERRLAAIDAAIAKAEGRS